MFLIIIIFAQQCLTFDLPHGNCKSDLNLDNNLYDVTNTYYVGDAYPTDAHYDKHGNLFFVEAGSSADGYYFNAKIIEHNKTESRNIPGLPDGLTYSIALDYNKGKVYFSTGKGIYAYNYETQNAVLISKPNVKFNMIFVDNNSNKYVTQNMDGIEEVYLLAGENKIRFKSLESLEEMAIDNKNNFYFIKNEKLFVLKSTLSKPILISNITFNGIAQISFYNENIFIASEKLTYFHENDTKRMKIIENIPEKVSAVAFDNIGKFVVGIYGKIIKYNIGQCYFRN